MARSRLSLICVSIAALFSGIGALFVEAARTFWAFLVAPWLETRPLDLSDEPGLAFTLPGGDQISPSLYQRNRHEAGLARLGAVRHR